jgi:hypothetical protein
MSPCFHQGVYHAVPQAGFLSRPAGSLQLSGQETPSGCHQGGSSWPRNLAVIQAPLAPSVVHQGGSPLRVETWL